jgi:hypothetical protein
VIFVSSGQDPYSYLLNHNRQLSVIWNSPKPDFWEY